jgi:hypothetical protein
MSAFLLARRLPAKLVSQVPDFQFGKSGLAAGILQRPPVRGAGAAAKWMEQPKELISLHEWYKQCVEPEKTHKTDWPE